MLSGYVVVAVISHNSLDMLANPCTYPLQDANAQAEKTALIAQSQNAITLKHRVELRFSKPPPDLKNGFVFGGGSESDIRLYKSNIYKPADGQTSELMNAEHFQINIDEKDRIVLHDHSDFGTSVGYDGQVPREFKKGFTWILFPDREPFIVNIQNTEVLLGIRLGRHDGCAKAYEEKLSAWYDKVKEARLRSTGLATPLRRLEVSGRECMAPLGHDPCS